MTSTPIAAVALRPFEAERDSASPNRNLTPVTTGLDPEGRRRLEPKLLAGLHRHLGQAPMRPREHARCEDERAQRRGRARR
mgnify:CR=1 FL=1